MAQSKTPMKAAAASLGMTPATFGAVWVAFGTAIPEIVLPLTGVIMAATAVGAYFATEALNADTDIQPLVGDVDVPPAIEV